jgi:hypothetical protein
MVSPQAQPQTMIRDGKPTANFKANRLLIAGLLVYLGVLFCYSLYLSQSRLLQVDECQNVYMARVLAAGQAQEFFTNGSLFLLGPLAWITRNLHHSAQIFDAARLCFLAVFWLNISLMAAIVGGHLFSLRRLIALVAAASLAPVWDYGFEIRHDNLVLTGVLLIWWAVRVKQWGWYSYLLAGAITVALLFIAVKAVVYVIPLSGALLLLPPASQKKSRWKLIAAWVGGGILATVLIRIVYGSSGGWEIYLWVFGAVSKYSAASNSGGGEASSRFLPWVALGRLPAQTPFLLALVLAACISVAGGLIRRFKASFVWDSYVPEAFLFLGALGDMFLNPSPYPYNLLHLVPYAFLLAFLYGFDVWLKIGNVPLLKPVIVAVLIFTNFVPFIMTTERHLEMTNARQKTLMTVAEALTDPVKDPVYDGIGMVPTRPSVHHQWYIHSLNLSFLKMPGFQIHEILAARPAAVVIFSYRTDWLPEEDKDFIQQRYVKLADDFSVLGTALPAGGGSFEIFHPGRYCVVPAASLSAQAAAASSETASSNGFTTGSLDGNALMNRPIQLEVGTHRIETSTNATPAIVWVGPTLDQLPPLSPGDHRFLFQNWY